MHRNFLANFRRWCPIQIAYMSDPGGHRFIEKSILTLPEPERGRMCLKFSHATTLGVDWSQISIL